jgi:hypothetical protein
MEELQGGPLWELEEKMKSSSSQLFRHVEELQGLRQWTDSQFSKPKLVPVLY